MTLSISGSFPLGLFLFRRLLLRCGEVTVILLHKSGSLVIHLPKRLHIGIALGLYNVGKPLQPFVDLMLQ